MITSPFSAMGEGLFLSSSPRTAQGESSQPLWMFHSCINRRAASRGLRAARPQAPGSHPGPISGLESEAPGKLFLGGSSPHCAFSAHEEVLRI